MLERNLILQTLVGVVLSVLLFARQRLVTPFRHPARIPVRFEALGRPIQLEVRIQANDRFADPAESRRRSI